MVIGACKERRSMQEHRVSVRMERLIDQHSHDCYVYTIPISPRERMRGSTLLSNNVPWTGRVGMNRFADVSSVGRCCLRPRKIPTMFPRFSLPWEKALKNEGNEENAKKVEPELAMGDPKRTSCEESRLSDVIYINLGLSIQLKCFASLRYAYRAELV